MIVILTGERGVGKTVICRKLCELVGRRGYLCKGFISPAIFKEGNEIGIEIIDLYSGERKILARVDEDLPGPRQGRYSFSEAALEWGRRLLSRATCIDKKCGEEGEFPSTILIIDEIGPLELEQGRGFVNWKEVLDKGEFLIALIVIRPELVDVVGKYLSGQSVVLPVDPSNRDELPQEIIDKFLERY